MFRELLSETLYERTNTVTVRGFLGRWTITQHVSLSAQRWRRDLFTGLVNA